MSRPASRVCRVVMAGPVEAFADAYRAHVGWVGYTALTTVNELREMSRWSRWLEAGGLRAGELSVERVEQFGEVQRSQGRRLACSRYALVCLLALLVSLGVVTVAAPARTS